jgi:hypothetical protein
MSLLFFIFFEKIGTKNLKHLMLEAKKPNSRATMDSFSIKLSKEIEILLSSFNFKQLQMAKFKASLNT